MIFVVIVGWKKIEDGVGFGLVMNSVLNFFLEFFKVSFIVIIEGIIG